jgi:CubicO group peptidase (beta-lactamase class C family)
MSVETRTGLRTGNGDEDRIRVGPFENVAPEAAGFSGDRLEALNAAMQAQVDGGKYAGITLGVARRGMVVNFRALGWRDREQDAPMRRDTIFRIASMTKPVTAVALMALYDEGRWSFDDPVSKFIPQFAGLKVLTPAGLVEPDHPMTMRELLTSTCGIPSVLPLEMAPMAGALVRNLAVTKLYAEADLSAGTVADMVEKISRLPLAYQPGSDFEYGLSHDVQGYVIERISGQGLDEFFRERIFEPLGMNDSGFGVVIADRERLATVYGYDEKGLLTPSHLDSSRAQGIQPAYLSGSGGLYSTAEDYLRFATMLAGGGVFEGARVLSPAAVGLMTRDLLPKGIQQHFAARLEGLGYGVGVGIVLDPGRASFNSGGFGVGTYYWTGMFGSWWWNDPVNDLTVIGPTQQDAAATAHVGLPHPAPDLRALSSALIYAALVDPAA